MLFANRKSAANRSTRSQQAIGNACAVESLERRTFLTATTVEVVASIPDASESHPTTTGQGEYVFKRPTGDTTLALRVKYAVNGDSTATSGDDFVPLSGTITIPAGKRGVALKLTPINDSIHEGLESVIVSVKNQTGYTVTHRNAVVTIHDNDPAESTQGWWNTSYHFRAPLTVNVGSYGRSDTKPVEQSLNFTTLLHAAGGSGSIIDNSIRVIETNAAGTSVVDSDVPFQFDKASDYNASTNASGNLIFTLKGNTAANATRYYHVYFDTAGTFSAYNFTPQVTTDASSSDEGMDAVKITTTTATYWLQKANGGFSSIVDTAGNDWLGFDPTSGSEAGGEFRGTPNAVFPGGGFHAGFTDGSTTVVNSGPLKTTLLSTMSIDKGNGPQTYVMKYEIYSTYVTATMVTAPSSYWFLYEGTPGGSLDSNDSVVRSDGTTTDISTSWNADGGIGANNGQDWVYFDDSGVGKHMYYVDNTNDGVRDSYFRQDANGSMSVFGFGRDNDQQDPNRERLTTQNNSFTFGIADDGSDFNANAAAINGTYHSIALATGSGQKLS